MLGRKIDFLTKADRTLTNFVRVILPDKIRINIPAILGGIGAYNNILPANYLEFFEKLIIDMETKGTKTKSFVLIAPDSTTVPPRTYALQADTIIKTLAISNLLNEFPLVYFTREILEDTTIFTREDKLQFETAFSQIQRLDNTK